MYKKLPVNFEAEKLVSLRKNIVFFRDIKKSLNILLSKREDSYQRYVEVKAGDSLTKTFASSCIQIDKKREVFLLLTCGWKVNIKKCENKFFIDLLSPSSHKSRLELVSPGNRYSLHTFILGSHNLSFLLMPFSGLFFTFSCSYGVRNFSLFTFLFLNDSLMRFIISKPCSIIDEDVSEREEDWKYLVSAPILLELGKDLLSLLSRNSKDEFLNRISSIRKHLLLDTGILIPTVRIKDNLGLRSREFMVSIKDKPVGSGEVYMKRLLAIGPADCLKEIKGRKVLDPTYHMSGVWITSSHREMAEKFGCMIFDPVSVIATLITEVLRRYTHEFLGIQETEDLLERSLKAHPVVLRELHKVVSLIQINTILKNLLAENISIRDLLTICETVIEYSKISKDADLLGEYSRVALRDSICQEHTTFDGKIFVSLLDPDLENRLLLNLKKIQDRNVIQIDDTFKEKIFLLMKKRFEACQNRGLKTIILCSPRIRLYLRRLLEKEFPDFIILSYNEIARGVQVNPLSVITLKKKFKREDFSDREYFKDLGE